MAAIAAAGISAVASIASAKANKGGGAPKVVPTHWTKQGEDVTTESSTITGYQPAMSGVDQSLLDAQNLYSNQQGYTPEQIAALNANQNLAIQRGGQSQWLQPGANLAQQGVAGQLGIGAGDIGSYTSALNNNQAINNQMAALEYNSSRRLREQLIPEIRGSYDAAGMYNSGLAQQAEQRAARDVSESLNAQELGFRGNQYAPDQALAAQQLGGNRDYQTQAGAALANYGQQGLQNLQQAGTAQYTHDQNVLDAQRNNQVGQGQYGWEQLAKLQGATLSPAQAFAAQDGTTIQNYNSQGTGEQVVGGGSGGGGGSPLASGLSAGLQSLLQPVNKDSGAYALGQNSMNLFGSAGALGGGGGAGASMGSFFG